MGNIEEFKGMYQNVTKRTYSEINHSNKFSLPGGSLSFFTSAWYGKLISVVY